MRLQDKTAIVTGGGSGIGRAVASAVAREGAQVAIADIAVENANKVAAEIKGQNGRALTCRVDLSQGAQVQSMVKSVLDQLGRIDILINCAGWDRLEPFIQSTEETWDKIIAINFKSVLHTTKAVLPHMIERSSGKIVNIASDAGRVGSSWEAVYSGTKGAIIAFSKTLAREVARHKINVNVICPGMTDTPLLDAIRRQSEQTAKIVDAVIKATPFRRAAKPEEIAAAVVFLSSSDADFITGQTLSVSGGLTMV
ncbi:MAG: SDR family NAD(P)-dependent oxidoreductase [Candidatus Binatia bacterium]